jgi:hypothetical protein
VISVFAGCLANHDRAHSLRWWDLGHSSGGGTWDTGLYTVRGVGSGSRDVDSWCANGCVHRGSGVLSTDDPGAW